ncbi:DEAD/DEAH box helicase [Desulfococcus sp.]|uniref:DEAD/DEAH box helicase n=1 Tax=Desulfococcus sp. TaxID=2025834 RepID=UPI00359468A3
MNFSTLGLTEALAAAAADMGFETPTTIQARAIPALLAGEQDFVGLAETGTGKTGAFGLPLIQRIHPAETRPQAVVICPTRELCLQITEDLKNFARHMRDIRIIAVYGGASIAGQIHLLKRGPQIIVATPGRLLDLLNRKAVALSHVSCAVLDEADEMLNMGFKEDIDSILGQMPEERRIWLFSATMADGVAAIARNYLKDPVEVRVGGRKQSPKAIHHSCYMLQEKHRYQGLKRIIDFTPEIFGLVFCRTRLETQTVAEALMQDGYLAEALHGDLSQAQRDYVMRKFRQQAVRILVATDVAARGLDVDDITHIIHYRLPDETEIYTHRSGRTARAGKSGESIALINTREMPRIRELEARRNIRFTFSKLPDGRAICEKRVFGLVEKIVRTDVDEAGMAHYLPAIRTALEPFDKEEIIKRFISAEFNRFNEYYRTAEDIHVTAPPNKTAAPKPEAPKKSRPKINPKINPKIKKTRRFFINIGRLDKITEKTITRLISSKAGIGTNMIGAVDLKREFSFFEVERSAAGKLRNSFENVVVDGRRVEVREAERDKKAA